MEKMFLKRNPLVFVPVLLLLLLGVVFISYTFFLPRYIENTILPDLGRRLSSSLSGRVYTIGLSNAVMGDIRLGDGQNTAVSISSIHADYSIASLFAKKLERLKVNGLTLNMEIADGRFILPGIDLEENVKQESVQKSAPDSSEIELPLVLSDFQVNNGLLHLQYKGQRFLIPFDLQLNRKPAGDKPLAYDFSLQMMPQGEEISVSGSIDLADNKSVLTFVSHALDLNRFAVLDAGGGPQRNFGSFSIRGETEIGLLPLQLVSANLRIAPASPDLGKTPVHLGQMHPDAGPALSMELKSDREQWQLKVQGVMRQPLPASYELSASMVQDQEGVKSTGDIVLRLTETGEAEKRVQPALSLESSPELHGDFVLGLTKSGAWTAELKSPGQKQQQGHTQMPHLHYGNINLQADMPTLTVHGQGTTGAGEVQAMLAIPKVRANFDGAAMSIPEAILRASYQQEEDPDSGRISSGTLSITLKRTKFQKDGLHSKADISLQGTMVPQVIRGDDPVQAEGRITIANAELTEGDSGVTLGGMKGNIPWFWPQNGRKMTGEVKAAKIRWQDLDLGTIKAGIRLQDMMYFLDGNYNSSLLKGVVAKISGKAGITDSGPQGEFALQTDVTPFASMHLGKLNNSLKNSYLSGELGMDGSLKFESGNVKGRMQVKLQNGTFEFPEKKYEMRGIDLSMLIPSLPDLRTAPAQSLHFSEASIGDLAFSKGKLVWQLESAQSVFLEEGVVQWAGGRVFTNAVRISPEMDKFVVPIFCDRLKLTELLHQFGISNAEGQGTVNGRIPLLVGKKTISVEDGFLYSSPGQGGSVKVSALDVLAAGIPKNTPQFAQVDFAAEALKNFQYNWVRLLLDSEGEDLIMQMHMDGKPVQSLPFIYDSQKGLLTRTDDAKQGIDQPIRLDVNFRLPLNRFLGYSGKIQDIMEKIK